MSTVWLDDLSSANLLRKTYVSGFLDISGGDMNVRSGNFFTGGLITQNTDATNVATPNYSVFSITDLSYMFASINQPMATFAQDITTNGNTIVKRNLIVSNDVSMSAKLSVAGDASMNSRLFLGGDASLNGKLFLGGDVSLNSRLFLGGDASLNGKLTLVGDASLNSRLFLRGDASLNSRLAVAGDASLNSRLAVAGDASLNSNVQLASTSSIYGGTISGITNDLNVYGLNVGAGDISANSKLAVAGDVSLNSKLAVVGDVSLNSNLQLASTSSIYGGSISGITNDLNVYGLNVGAGDISANSRLFVASDVSINGNLNVNTNTNLNGTLNVYNNTFAYGNIAIGKTTAGSALDVSGGALVSSNVSIGTSINSHKLNIRSDTLSSVLSSTSNSVSLVGSLNENISYLNIYNYRHTAGTTWIQASTRIQNVIDITNKAYIEFNPPGNSSDPGGIGIYTASTSGLSDISGGITIKSNGNVAIGKTAANATLDISGTALVSGNIGIGKTTAATALDVSGGALVSGNVAIGKTTATVALDVSGRFIVNGSISYSNYYFKFVGSNSLAITNGASIGFTNSTGTPYNNSGYTQGTYFLAPVTGYYHLNYNYNLAGSNSTFYIGFIISATDPTGYTYNQSTWSNSNIIAINIKEFVTSSQFNGTLTTDAYLTSGQRVYIILASAAATPALVMYSWGNPGTNVWTGYLISQ
jgi:hypothetical protein